jgi:hypothetical protein
MLLSGAVPDLRSFFCEASGSAGAPEAFHLQHRLVSQFKQDPGILKSREWTPC